MQSKGMIPRGTTRSPSELRISLHDAGVATMTLALDGDGEPGKGLQLAIRVKDWRPVGVAPGWRRTPNYTVEGIGDITLVNLMSAQLQTGAPRNGGSRRSSVSAAAWRLGCRRPV
jgi:hypothetical protein